MSSIRNDIPSSLKEKRLLVLVCVGILIRIIIMPFFSHVDLFSEFRRVMYSLNNDIYFPHQHRLVTFYIEYAFLAVLSPLLKDPDIVFFLEDVSKSTSNLSDYFVFINHPNVFRHLFIFKLSYLIFDVLTMWVIWLFFDDKKRACIALLFWVFNPITLYASYFFGRYETIPLLFMALTALFLKKKQPLAAAFCLSLAINGREIYVVTAPIFLLALYNENEKWHQNVKTILLTGSVLFASFVLPIFLEKYFHLSPAFAQGSVYQDSKANVLYGMSFKWLYPLVFAYFFALLALQNQAFISYEYKFIVGSGVVLACYFLIAAHSAHYVAWLPLFPVLLLNYVKDPRKLGFAIFAFFMTWFAYRIFKADINLFTLFLAAPFNFELTFFPSVSKVFTEFVGETSSIFDPIKILNVLHSMYAAALVFLVYRMVHSGRHHNNKTVE